MDLKTLQKNFVANVTSEHSSLDELFILPAGSLSKEQAMGIYREDYFARLKDALATNYEATWIILGDEDFFNHAEQYVITHPSELNNLTNYGNHFPAYLAKASKEASQMAYFERSFWTYFHMKDQSSIILNPEIISEAFFDLAGITLIQSELRLDLIWENREGGSNLLSELDLYEECYFAIYKAEAKVEIKKISKIEYDVLYELSHCSKLMNLSPREIEPESWKSILEVLKFSKLRSL
jgi:hypothetical protein